MITKYGSGDGRILKDKKKTAAADDIPVATDEASAEWTAKDQAELLEEQADSIADGD